MTSLPFRKYQGTGNDFIVVDGLAGLPEADWPAVAKRLCDRHYGVGADGLILVLPGQEAAFKMTIFNADGSEPEMCGNGLRCFVRFLEDAGRAPAGPFPVETGAGVLKPELLADGQIRIDMGPPILERQRIPMGGPRTAQVVDEPVKVGEQTFAVTAVSMGNPHAVIFVPDVSAVPLAEWGPALETQHQADYYREHGRSLLEDYLAIELEEKTRVIYENHQFVVLVPFWAVWPFETMILPRRHIRHIGQMDDADKTAFADAIKRLTMAYDRVFNVSFPYSAGIHQRPTDGQEHPGWHLHMHFYPPLLRSASVKKFMVGYEMLGDPQRDITPETSAERLRGLV